MQYTNQRNFYVNHLLTDTISQITGFHRDIHAESVRCNNQWCEKRTENFCLEEDRISSLYLFKSSFSSLRSVNKKLFLQKQDPELKMEHLETSILLMSNFPDRRHTICTELEILTHA